MRGNVREIHLLLLNLKGLAELLDAGLGPTDTIHPLGERQGQKTAIEPQLTLVFFSNTAGRLDGN